MAKRSLIDPISFDGVAYFTGDHAFLANALSQILAEFDEPVGMLFEGRTREELRSHLAAIICKCALDGERDYEGLRLRVLQCLFAPASELAIQGRDRRAEEEDLAFNRPFH